MIRKETTIKVFASTQTNEIKIFIPYHLNVDYLERVFEAVIKDLREEE